MRLNRPLAGEDAQGYGLLVTIVMMAAFGIVASTIYAPSVPAIAQSLKTPLGTVQLSFVSYLTAFACSMLLLGPASDHFGRRPVLLGGLALAILASLACALAPTGRFLVAARALQGAGACAAMVVGRALIRDRYGRSEAARVIAQLSFAVTLAQAAAPVIGAFLQQAAGWRANFVAVTGFAVITFALASRYVPADAPGCRGKIEPRALFAAYHELLGSRRFVAYALAATGASAGFQIFSAVGSAVIVGTMSVSPQAFGLYAILPPAGFLLGSFLSQRYTARCGLDRMVTLGGLIIVAAGAVQLVLTCVLLSAPAIIGPVTAICCGSGLLTPNAVAGALSVRPDMAGAASGLASFVQLSGAAAATTLLATIPGHGPVALAAVIAAAGLMAGLAAIVLAAPSRNSRPRPQQADGREISAHDH
jgi:MFS transporter, DHA1 family, multidrug resistance protein